VGRGPCCIGGHYTRCGVLCLFGLCLGLLLRGLFTICWRDSGLSNVLRVLQQLVERHGAQVAGEVGDGGFEQLASQA
jgi:hypothetical protein